MKYHFMRISATAVRIELIAEDPTEKLLLQQFSLVNPDNASLSALFDKAILLYQPNVAIVKKNFMDFPRVALCSYQTVSNLSTITV